VHAAIPADWMVIINAGYSAFQAGEWVLASRRLPPLFIFRVDSVVQGEVHCTRFACNEDGTFAGRDGSPAVLAVADAIRCYVVQHRSGLLCEGPIDTLELLPSKIVIAQHYKRIVTPILSSSVHGSCAALTALVARAPTFPSWTNDLAPYRIPWRRVWRWVWVPYRDRKVGNFFWRLLHRSLFLGTDRARYSHDTDCSACPTSIESYSHLFDTCPVFARCWLWFTNIWHAVSGSHLDSSLVASVFCSLPPSRIRSRARLAYWRVLLIAHGELLYSVWLSRCRAVFDGVLFSAAVVTAVARFRISRAIVTLQSAHRYRDTIEPTATQLLAALTR
jgi:hypothetical protein